MFDQCLKIPKGLIGWPSKAPSTLLVVVNFGWFKSSQVAECKW